MEGALLMMFRSFVLGFLLCYCGSAACVVGETPPANSPPEYEVFVLESKGGKTALCSVKKRLLTSNEITIDQFSIFLRDRFDALGEVIASAAVKALGGSKVDVSKPRRPAGLSDAQEKGCIQVLRTGVLLHEYEIQVDGTLGKMTWKKRFRIVGAKITTSSQKDADPKP